MEQNVAWGLSEASTFSYLRTIGEELPIFMLSFSFDNSFGNNWGTQQQSFEKSAGSFVEF